MDHPRGVAWPWSLGVGSEQQKTTGVVLIFGFCVHASVIARWIVWLAEVVLFTDHVSHERKAAGMVSVRPFVCFHSVFEAD